MMVISLLDLLFNMKMEVNLSDALDNACIMRAREKKMTLLSLFILVLALCLCSSHGSKQNAAKLELDVGKKVETNGALAGKAENTTSTIIKRSCCCGCGCCCCKPCCCCCCNRCCSCCPCCGGGCCGEGCPCLKWAPCCCKPCCCGCTGYGRRRMMRLRRRRDTVPKPGVPSSATSEALCRPETVTKCEFDNPLPVLGTTKQN
uniref:Uncharacterized protein n=1 Tax=Globodera rostochiensis TaxID=31243 RepID=A0A914GUH1_GLORO